MPKTSKLEQEIGEVRAGRALTASRSRESHHASTVPAAMEAIHGVYGHHATIKKPTKQPKGALMRNISTPFEEKYQTWDGNVTVTNFKRGLWSVHPRGHAPFMVGSKREAFDQALGITSRKWGAK